MTNKPTLREQIKNVVLKARKDYYGSTSPTGLEENVDQILKLIEERIPKETTNEYWMARLNVESHDYSYGHRNGWNFCIEEMKKRMK